MFKKVTGFRFYTANICLNHCDITNSYFKNGFVYMNVKEKLYGFHKFENSKFENNTSESGTFLNISYFPIEGGTKVINVSNSTFINNTASKFGGVYYILGETSYLRMFFDECSYDNNHAQFGNVIYGDSNDTLPIVGSLSSNDISTIPAYFERYGNETERISILSGEIIPKGIMCKWSNLNHI